MFRVYALCLITLSFWWWWRVNGRLKTLRHGRVWRVMLAGFVIATIAFPVAANQLGHFFPAFLPAVGFLWHVLMVIPAFVAIGIMDLAGRRRPDAAADETHLGRRRFLIGLAAAGPPLITAGLALEGLHQIGRFRVRALDVPVDGLPSGLEGFTIAYVADVHTGPFCTAGMLEDIVRRTNGIHNGGPADLVVFGGDLINTTLRDLPAGLEMLRALRGRLGMVACMGNHDVMDDEFRFSREVRRAGIPLLRDETMILEARPGVAVQFLGVDWRIGDAALFQSVAAVAARRDSSAFPICLAHHPHAWDEAVRQGLPLVLSGHTHGGQIMLTENIGAGPLKFRYWTGMHRRGGSTLVISNGVGNWFPLRVNAPAEILKLTLRSGARRFSRIKFSRAGTPPLQTIRLFPSTHLQEWIMRLSRAIRYALVLPLAMVAMPARASVLYNETVSGDLSNNQAAPTALTLSLGTNSVIGNVNGSGGDTQDWLALTVPAGLTLNSDILAAYTSTDNQGFTGFQVGSSFVGSPLTASPYAGYSHFGKAATNTGQPTANLVGVDLLPLMANPTIAAGASGFTLPLGPGTYTFLIQQLGASTTYQFDFVTSSVPEPTSLGLLGVGVFGLLRRRRR